MIVDPNDFDPRDLKPDVWLRGDWGTGASWPDKSLSGTGVTVTQPTGARQPTQHVDAGSNKPVLRGDTTQHLDFAGMGLPTSCTYVFVVTPAVAAASYVTSGDTVACGLIENFNGATVQWFNGNGADLYTFVTNPTAGLHIYTLTQVNGSSIIGYYDGAQVFSGTPTTAMRPVGAVLGALGFAVNGSDSDMAEVILWSRVLLPGERKRLHRYLGSRYKLPVTLA